MAVGEVVILGKETGVAIVTSLDYMQRKAGEMDTGAAGHASKPNR
jgi:hypothetical protein